MSAQIETLLDDPIELALAESAIELAKKRQRWNAVRDFYRPILNAFVRLGLEPRLSNDVDVSFTGDAHKLAGVVRILRTSGFETTSGRPKPGDTSWYAYYSHPEVTVKVWLNFTSSVCRRVKVGSKMVEQDIYEVQCGDISAEITEIEVPAPAIEQEVPF